MKRYWHELEEPQIDGWNMTRFNGPLKISATVFTEEEKELARTWMERMPHGSPEVCAKVFAEIMEMIHKFKYEDRNVDPFLLVELLSREEGR